MRIDRVAIAYVGPPLAIAGRLGATDSPGDGPSIHPWPRTAGNQKTPPLVETETRWLGRSNGILAKLAAAYTTRKTTIRLEITKQLADQST